MYRTGAERSCIGLPPHSPWHLSSVVEPGSSRRPRHSTTRSRRRSKGMVLDEVSRASPIEGRALEEADERQLLGILGFKRRRRARRRQRLILTGLIGAMLALFMLAPVGKTVVSRTRPTEPPLTDEISASPIVEKI